MVDLGALGSLDLVNTPFACGTLQARNLTSLNERDGFFQMLAIQKLQSATLEGNVTCVCHLRCVSQLNRIRAFTIELRALCGKQ
jgi:hypothetical protein